MITIHGIFGMPVDDAAVAAALPMAETAVRDIAALQADAPFIPFAAQPRPGGGRVGHAAQIACGIARHSLGRSRSGQRLAGFTRRRHDFLERTKAAYAQIGQKHDCGATTHPADHRIQASTS